MAMKDVELVIRAKDSASASLKSVTESLNGFQKAQADVAKQSGATGNAVARLGAEAAALGKQAEALKSFDNVAKSVERAASAVARLDTATTAANKELADYTDQLGKVDQDTKRQIEDRDKAKAAWDKERAAVVAAREELQKYRDAATSAKNRVSEIKARQLEAGGRGKDKAVDAELKTARDENKTARAEKARAGATYDAQIAGLKQLEAAAKAAYSAADKSAREAEKSQAALAARVEQAKAKFAEESAQLQESSKQYDELRKSAEDAAKTLGVVEVSTAGVSKALVAVQQDLARTNAALAGVGTAAKATADYRAQQQAVRDLSKEYAEARQVATLLGRQMAQAESPTRELGKSFDEARAKVKQLEQAMMEQGRALQNMRGQRGIPALAAREEQVKPTVAAVPQSWFDQVKRAIREYMGLSEASRKASDSIERTHSSLKKSGEGSREALSYFQRLRGEVLRMATDFVGLYATIGAVKSVLGTMRELDATRSRLSVVFDGNQAQIANEMRAVQKVAHELGLDFGVLGKSYAGLAIAGKSANFEIQDSRKLMLGLAQAARVSQLTGPELEGVTRAMEQMVSKGKIGAEELRGQLGERMSGAFQLFATALGVSASQLDKMMQKGEVFADKATMLKIADRLAEVYGKQVPDAMKTTTAQLDLMKVGFKDAQEDFMKGGFLEGMNRALATLQKGFGKREGTSFFESLGAAAGKTLIALSSLAAGIGALASKFGGLAPLITVFVAFKLATQFNDMTAAVTRTIEGVKAFAASVTAAGVAGRTATMAFGGWLTLLLQIAAVIGTFLFASWVTKVEDATEALNRHNDLLDKVRQGYDDAKGSVENWSKAVKDVTEISAKANLQTLKSSELSNRKSVADPFGEGLSTLWSDKALRIRTTFAQVDARFRDGKITAQEYLKGVQTAFKEAEKIDSEIATKFAARREAIAQQGIALSDSIQKAEAAVEVASGKATEKTAIALGVKGAKSEIKVDLTPSPEFLEAVKTLQGKDAGMANVLAMREAKELLDKALKLAKTPEQKAQARRAYANVVGPLRAQEAFDREGGESLLSKAESMRGTKETDSSLQAFLRTNGVNLDPAKIAWCAGFVNAVLNSKGLPGTGSLGARSFTNYGSQVDPTKAQEGDIVVLKRGNDPAKGHVGFFQGYNEDGTLNVLGGNTGNKVASARYSADQVVAVRRAPSKAEVAEKNLEFANTTEADLEALRKENKLLEDRNAKIRERKSLAKSDIEGKVALIEGEYGDNRERAVNDATKTFTERAQKNLVNTQTEDFKKQLAEVAALTAAKYDLTHAEEKENTVLGVKKEFIQDILGLDAQRRQLSGQLQEAIDNGDTDEKGRIEKEIEAVNKKLEEGIPLAKAWAEAMGDSKTVASLLKAEKGVGDLTKQMFRAKDINQDLASVFVQSFDAFAKAVAEGKNGWKAFTTAFRQAASDFLLTIAKMIMQTVIFNVLSSAFGGGPAGGGGVGGLIANALNGVMNAGQHHSGGIAGSNSSRRVSPAVFAGAARFHMVGLPGLDSSEVPAILQEGEEVLTRNDPRHVMNGGKASAAPSVTVINTLDPGEFVSKGLNTGDGKSAILNFMRANSGAVKGALG